MDAVLELKGVSKRDKTGRSILHGLDLMVKRTERICIHGDRDELAALARVIGGIDRPEAGEVYLLGQQLNEMDDRTLATLRGEHIGYVSRDPGLWAELTVLENTAMPLTAAGVHRYDRADAAFAALETVGMEYAAHVYPKSLSLCELRLAALARALVRAPALLVLEDALAGLDRQEADRFADAVERRWAKDGFGLLYLAGDTNKTIRTDKTLALLYGRLQGDGI